MFCGGAEESVATATFTNISLSSTRGLHEEELDQDAVDWRDVRRMRKDEGHWVEAGVRVCFTTM